MKTARGALLAWLVSSSLAASLSVALVGCNSRFAFDEPAGQGGVGGTPATAGGAGMPLGGAGTPLGGAGTPLGGAGTAAGGAASSACGIHSACPSNLHCVDDQCYPCAVDGDCVDPGLSHCDPGRHRCVACVSPTDCAAGFSCDTLANHCLQACVTDHDCPVDADGCDGRRRVCYQCDDDEDCAKSALGPLCATDHSACVRCRDEPDCPGQHCDSLVGRCVECRGWQDCDSGLCDPLTFTCIEKD